MAQPEHERADPPGPQHLAATASIDAGHPGVRAFAERAVAEAATDCERISRLFTAVRDEIRYDPYQLSHEPRDCVASNVITPRRGLLHPQGRRVSGAWRKATPAFNAELCERFGVTPLTFDSSADALLHRFAADGSTYMEYIRDRGVYADLPLASILEVFVASYPGFGTGPADVEDPAFSA